jgi:hypothetical protein
MNQATPTNVGGCMKEEHKEEQNKYTVAFFAVLIILIASVLAVTLKSFIVWFGQ